MMFAYIVFINRNHYATTLLIFPKQPSKTEKI